MSSVYREAAEDNHLVTLTGPLNALRAERTVQLFQDISEHGIERVVVNLEDVPFIDSSGLAALIAGYKIFGSDADNFQLIGAQDQPRLVFELTGFDHIFRTDDHLGNNGTEVIALKPLIRVSPVRRLPTSVPQLAVLELGT
jgi:anti-anti-sigma factor